MQNSKAQTTKSRAGKYLTFKLGDEDYGLDILNVIEIVGMQNITPVPKTPDYMRGVVNLRGIIHPVIDLNQKFGMGLTKKTDLTCIIVVTVEAEATKEHLGIIVDQVSEVEDIAAEDIEDPPAFGTEINTNFIIGMAKIKKRVKMLLDLKNILSTQELNMISKVSEQNN